MDLIETLRSPEGKTLEFKRDLSSPDPFKRTVVAFANTAGGTILVGVEDKTGYVRGVEEPLSLEERVASLISDSISPEYCQTSKSLATATHKCSRCRYTRAQRGPTSSLAKASKLAPMFEWAPLTVAATQI